MTEQGFKIHAVIVLSSCDYKGKKVTLYPQFHLCKRNIWSKYSLSVMFFVFLQFHKSKYKLTTSTQKTGFHNDDSHLPHRSKSQNL